MIRVRRVEPREKRLRTCGHCPPRGRVGNKRTSQATRVVDRLPKPSQTHFRVEILAAIYHRKPRDMTQYRRLPS